jgi:hypothetical protein
MKFKLLYPGVAIALLSLTACTNPTPDTEAPPEADMPADTEVSTPESEAPTMEIAEGVSLSEDGSTLVMAEFSHVRGLLHGR